MVDIQINIQIDEAKVWANGTVEDWAGALLLEEDEADLRQKILQAIAMEFLCGGEYSDFVLSQTVVTKTE